MGKRSGLMRARVAGARAATGATLTFLDSHISCDIGWLEPLMFRIAQGRWHIVMPMIDGADRECVALHYLWPCDLLSRNQKRSVAPWATHSSQISTLLETICI